ncbi:hypothetical protein [Rhizobium aethiopicum]|uniref:Peptidase M41 domain-containing protein n=1 Tax=Rhizobium aethiopicum TaxID=1138170 RepID=A0A7W6VRT3_9HYPH|nr:hypothetical protein [Rhizobium aethiopicum]MBB4194880.1 hypothetical protein [Rhizobium aethiopicum]
MVSQTALHEAAHVLAALGNGIDVRHVSIDAGEVVLLPPGEFLERGHHHGAVAAAYGIVALAGQAAAPETDLSQSDLLLLRHALFLASWADPPEEMNRALSAAARQFVLDHRQQIEKLALILDERRCLTGAEIAEVISGQ